jgi:hypothetical protein
MNHSCCPNAHAFKRDEVCLRSKFGSQSYTSSTPTMCITLYASGCVCFSTNTFIYPDHVHHSLCKWLCLLFHKYECICFHFSVIAGQRWPGSNHHPETNSKGRRGDSFYSLHSVCHQKKTRFYLWMLSRKCCDCYFQVTVSYIDEDLPFEDRQALLADYGFKCRCNACLEQDPNKK